MMEKDKKFIFSNLKNTFDILGVKKQTKENECLMRFVANDLSKHQFGGFYAVPTFLSRDKLIDRALNTLKVYSSDAYGMAHELLTTKEYVIMNDPFLFNTRVDYEVMIDENDNKIVQKESGKVSHFKVPYDSHISDTIWYAHEAIHGLKENNYLEYTNFLRYSDVIPLFHELLSSSSINRKTMEEWRNVRYYFLSKNILEINETLADMKYDKENAELYEININMCGQYLISFYYALILFDLYLKNQKLVISQINRVLNHEITTEEMLIELNIFKQNDELNNIYINTNQKIMRL